MVLLGQSLREARRSGLSFRACLEQVEEIGGRSAWLVISGMAFFGVVMVTIAHQQATKFTGNITVLGAAYFELMVREFGPMTVALLAASRAGAGASAELASMTVNEQVEALRMSAGDPLSDLVAPRVVGSVIALPLLCVFGTLAASFSAALTASIAFGADGYAFIDPRYIDGGDLACAAIKSLLCGLYIPAVVSWRGLSATGGAPAVGLAVTRGVVDACLGCLVIDFLVALAFFIARV